MQKKRGRFLSLSRWPEALRNEEMSSGASPPAHILLPPPQEQTPFRFPLPAVFRGTGKGQIITRGEMEKKLGGLHFAPWNQV